jgi:release factor glutamine methyltransferase
MAETTMGATTDPRAVAEPPVTVRALLLELTGRLAKSDAIQRPKNEARELLAALLGVQRFWPDLNSDAAVEGEWRERALAAAAKRVCGAPLAYCVGKAAFRHLTLEVDERVLIPRPETEQLVDVAISAAGTAAGGIAVDVGTGSGAIALALASEAQFDCVIATDVSLDALAVARRNAERLRRALRATVDFRDGSLLTPLGDMRARLIVSNPPYVANPEAAALPASVRDWEPPIALLSGGDGLHATARLVREAAERLLPGGALALETDSRRAGAVADLAEADSRFTDVKVSKDLAGRERFVVARRKEDG